jgi:hypothetical protein
VYKQEGSNTLNVAALCVTNQGGDQALKACDEASAAMIRLTLP